MHSLFISVALFLIVLAIYFHLTLGINNFSFSTLLNVIFNYNQENFNHYIIYELRFPRALIATFIGFSLGIVGPIIQGILNNKLISMNILGINTGASFAVVVGLVFFNLSSMIYLPIYAFLGAISTFLFVTLLAKNINNSQNFSLKLLLCGAMIKALLSAIITLVLLLDEQTLANIRLWLSGDITAMNLKNLYLPFLIILICASLIFLFRHDINLLSISKDVATRVGMNTLYITILILILIVILCSVSVAILGPIGFIGFTSAHIARLFGGSNYKKLIIYSGFIGTFLLIIADIIARTIIMPFELSTGIVTALFGSPVFITLLIFHKKHLQYV